MNVYFVRHGETTSNLHKQIQGDDDQLTEKGFKQAEALANRLISIKFNKVISSPLKRTVQTADIFKDKIQTQYEINSLFSEIKTPSKLVGRTKEDPITAEVNALKKANTHDIFWKFEDEESFSEFRKRGLDAITYLETLGESALGTDSNILIFTHGKFLRMILSIFIFGPEVTKDQYALITELFYIHNTGITRCIFKKATENKPNRWRIVNWNDQSHFIS